MRKKTKKIWVMMIGFLITVQTKVFAAKNIESLFTSPASENTEGIVSVQSRIMKILGTAASILIPILLVIAIVAGVIVWAVIYSKKSDNKQESQKNENEEENK